MCYLLTAVALLTDSLQNVSYIKRLVHHIIVQKVRKIRCDTNSSHLNFFLRPSIEEEEMLETVILDAGDVDVHTLAVAGVGVHGAELVTKVEHAALTKINMTCLESGLML